jgi:hypothetical protein
MCFVYKIIEKKIPAPEKRREGVTEKEQALMGKKELSNEMPPLPSW